MNPAGRGRRSRPSLCKSPILLRDCHAACRTALQDRSRFSDRLWCFIVALYASSPLKESMTWTSRTYPGIVPGLLESSGRAQSAKKATSVRLLTSLVKPSPGCDGGISLTFCPTSGSAARNSSERPEGWGASRNPECNTWQPKVRWGPGMAGCARRAVAPSWLCSPARGPACFATNANPRSAYYSGLWTSAGSRIAPQLFPWLREVVC